MISDGKEVTFKNGELLFVGIHYVPPPPPPPKKKEEIKEKQIACPRLKIGNTPGPEQV